MELRVLTSEHFKKAISMTNLKARHGGSAPNAGLKQRLLHYFTPNPKAVALGYFEDGELISWATLRFGKQDAMNIWCITSLWTNRFHNYLNFDKPELGMLMKGCFDIAEHRKYWHYFYSIATKVEKVYQRQWAKNPWMPVGRYDLQIYQQVPANTIPTPNFVYQLMGGETKPDDITIKYRVLKEEHRQDYLELSDLEKDIILFDVNEVQAYE